jgi:exodeoxyribonuclease V alpha subunit
MRVQRVRGRFTWGATVSCLAIDGTGRALPGAPRYAVTFPSRITPVDVVQGQWWRVEGDQKDVEYVVDNYRVKECRVIARKAQLLRPSGEHLIQLLATSPAFPGIGEVKARRLWESLGEGLYDCLDHANHAALAQVVGETLAHVLISGWTQYVDADALRWFGRVGLELQLSCKIMNVYGGEALEAIQADPYRLLAFGMDWSALDILGRHHFGLPASDERRLNAAAEQVLYRAFDGGDTYCERDVLETALAQLIGPSLVAPTIALVNNGHCAHTDGSRVYALGPYLIEQSVAQGLKHRLCNSLPLTNPTEAEALLGEFEQGEAAVRNRGFALNPAQRSAVLAAVRHPLVLITGAGGTGKTTVLKAISHVLERCGQRPYIMALSGRATKRLTEVTRRRAVTIASFLRNVALKGMPENSVLIIDEASMLDVLLAYRVLKVIPDSCRLILIGDPFQLPPVGPGLTLHALVSVDSIPCVELTDVKRHGGAIAAGAQAVREGRWPAMSGDATESLAFLPCSPEHVANTVLKHYLSDPLNTQILTFTRERGPASSKSLNAMCQNAFAKDQSRLLVWNTEWDRQEDSGLRLGEPVLCTRNFWEWGIQNGSLGRIETIEDVPQPLFNSEGEPAGIALAWVRWDDGELRPVTEEILDSLELGYAVTVHKAQGSQFKRVIIAVCSARNLDRTMLYTAITRGEAQVLLIGDAKVSKQAIESLPHASHRNVSLADMLKNGAT